MTGFEIFQVLRLFATKLLMVVTDPTNETFLVSLEIFVARRVKHQELFSDRGVHFIGAYQEKKMMSRISYYETI